MTIPEAVGTAFGREMLPQACVAEQTSGGWEAGVVEAGPSVARRLADLGAMVVGGTAQGRLGLADTARSQIGWTDIEEA